MKSLRFAVLFSALLLAGCAATTTGRYQMFNRADGRTYLVDTATGTAWILLDPGRSSWEKVNPPAELAGK